MAELKIAVIGGAGGQGSSWIRRIKNWKRILEYDLKLAAICDVNKLGLEAQAKKYNCKSYLDYKEMLEKEELDVVIIATPHFLHAPMTIAAAEHGINVLTEKPMCINLKQADEMKKAVEKSKIKLAVGFQMRFHNRYRKLKNIVDSGDLGDIFQINMLYHWWRTENYYLNSSPTEVNADEDWEGWRGHWKTEGAGAIANQIVHHIDLFQWISPSPVKSIMATSRVAKHTFIEVDDNTNAIVEFQNDSMGLIQAGVAYEHDRDEIFAIYGINGSVVYQKKYRGFLGIPKNLIDYRNKELKKRKKFKEYGRKLILDISKALFENFLQSIKEDDPSIISVDVNEGRKSIEIMRAILLSNKYQKKIVFPFDDPADEFPTLPHPYIAPEFKDMI
ncbi:MAG: Gfo/Idh/MocA family protein [Promethearchaeota archaeon]